VKGFTANARGTTAIEYTLIASLVSIVILMAVTSIGTALSGFFTSVATNLR
jgi:Flp pilus assembly pilin Flp